MSQQVYAADTGALYAVEVWDLIVGPGKKSEPATLPGAAVLEIRSGSGTAILGKESRDVRIGATLTIAEDDQLAFANRSTDQPLTIRATIVRARK